MAFLGGKRTRQSDRDVVLDALGAAYADGQIDEHEHGLRVSRALRAVELQTLRAQIYDLQIPDDHPAHHLMDGEHVPARSSTPVPRRKGISRWWYAAGAAGVAAAVGIGVASTGSEGDADELDLLTVECLEELVEDVEDEFGSSEVVAVELHDTWAWVYVPADGGGSRYDLYTYSEDGFSQHQGGSLAADAPALVDLEDVDLERLVANIEDAPARLGIDGPVEAVVQVTDDYPSTDFAAAAYGNPAEAPPHVEIELTNDYMETASVTTDLDGRRILHEEPFERSDG
mgnify:CR=1 FL=1